jgi:hypothetical protein
MANAAGARIFETTGSSGGREERVFFMNRQICEVMSYEFLVNHDEKRLKIELICFFPENIVKNQMKITLHVTNRREIKSESLFI